MPQLHLIAGPNGSGKSSFVREVRSGKRAIDYDIPKIINPDEIALTLSPGDPDAASIAAGRKALAQLRLALASAESFAIETTFSGNAERRLVAEARAANYRVSMTYVSLDMREAYEIWPPSPANSTRSTFSTTPARVSNTS